MYTRSYPEKTVDIPDGYGGAAMPRTEPEVDEPYISDENKNPWERESEEVGAPVKGDSLFGGGLSGIFSGLFQNGRFSLQNIGFEEILIIAAAAYMLLSRDGDRECGIMLIILLLI